MNNCKWWQKIPYIVTVSTLEGLSPLRHFYMLPLVVLGQLASKSSLLGKTGPGEVVMHIFTHKFAERPVTLQLFHIFFVRPLKMPGQLTGKASWILLPTT